MRSPSFTARFFWPNGARRQALHVALHEAADRAMVIESSPHLTATDTQMRLLIIEDDRDSADYLVKAFREVGYVADLAGDGEEGSGARRER